MLVGYRRNGPVPHHHQVVAQCRKLAMLARSEPFTEAHKHQQRAHAPGNAKHGEKAAQLVGCDGAEDLAEGVRKVLHADSTLPCRTYCVDAGRSMNA